MSHEATTRCPKCGYTYVLEEKYEIDTWNVGHYGCTMNNAPRHFCGYHDPGCPNCKNSLPFKGDVISGVVITIGAKTTSRQMVKDKWVKVEEQQINFTINFNLIPDYLPITEAQEICINKIEKCTSHKFTGKDKLDAMEFIEAHIEESNACKEKIQIQRESYGTEEDYDDISYIVSKFY